MKDGLSIQNREVAGKLDQIGKVILVGSGKGGVGKSLVASGLALSLIVQGIQNGNSRLGYSRCQLTTLSWSEPAAEKWQERP